MADQEEQKALLGDPSTNFWLYSSKTGFDLTHPPTPDTPLTSRAISLETASSPVLIDPDKSALVIIDMQNFFLSTALGQPLHSKGIEAGEQLIAHAIPAARKAGVQIVWLNWGLTIEDSIALPPAVRRCFGFSTLPAAKFDALLRTGKLDGTQRVEDGSVVNKDLSKDTRFYAGLGKPLGRVRLPDGGEVDAGNMLMRDQWNSMLIPPLQQLYEDSLKTDKPDVWLHKTRTSGLHLSNTQAGTYFQDHGFKTLVFAGINTDQCVYGTLTDAHCQGYDTILLKDGTATTSPAGAQECVEYNAGGFMGFMLTCKGFADSVAASLEKSTS